MKIIKIISLFTTIVFFSVNLYSRDINSSKKLSLIIYNFSTTDNYSNIKEKEKNYQYYSLIIPETISKNLNKQNSYKIARETASLSIESNFTNDDEKISYMNKLKQKTNADFIITGTFNVINEKLSIKITILDIKGNEIKIIEHESDELGVRLQNTTDLISQRINEDISSLEKMNEERLNGSPFAGLYKPFSLITMGVDSGYFYILGDWGSLYNDSLYLTPFIDFDLFDNFLLSLKFTYIHSDSEDKDTTAYSEIKILSGSISLGYTYKFFDNFGIALTAGGGVTKTTITIEPDDPFSDPLAEKDSIDPNIDISSYFVYNLSAITFKAGVLYKRIFFKDKSMDTGTIFAGAGIHF